MSTGGEHGVPRALYPRLPGVVPDVSLNVMAGGSMPPLRSAPEEEEDRSRGRPAAGSTQRSDSAPARTPDDRPWEDPVSADDEKKKMDPDTGTKGVAPVDGAVVRPSPRGTAYPRLPGVVPDVSLNVMASQRPDRDGPEGGGSPRQSGSGAPGRPPGDPSREECVPAGGWDAKTDVKAGGDGIEGVEATLRPPLRVSSLRGTWDEWPAAKVAGKKGAPPADGGAMAVRPSARGAQYPRLPGVVPDVSLNVMAAQQTDRGGPEEDDSPRHSGSMPGRPPNDPSREERVSTGGGGAKAEVKVGKDRVEGATLRPPLQVSALRGTPEERPVAKAEGKKGGASVEGELTFRPPLQVSALRGTPDDRLRDKLKGDSKGGGGTSDERLAAKLTKDGAAAEGEGGVPIVTMRTPHDRMKAKLAAGDPKMDSGKAGRSAAFQASEQRRAEKMARDSGSSQGRAATLGTPEDRLTAKLVQGKSSGGGSESNSLGTGAGARESPEDRLRMKLVSDRTAPAAGHDSLGHDSLSSLGTPDDRLRAKLVEGTDHGRTSAASRASDRSSASAQGSFSSDTSLRRLITPEDRLVAKLKRDSDQSKSALQGGAAHDSISSVETPDDRLRAKISGEGGGTPHHDSISSAETPDDRLRAKLSGGSSARSSLESMSKGGKGAGADGSPRDSVLVMQAHKELSGRLELRDSVSTGPVMEVTMEVATVSDQVPDNVSAVPPKDGLDAPVEVATQSARGPDDAEPIVPEDEGGSSEETAWDSVRRHRKKILVAIGVAILVIVIPVAVVFSRGNTGGTSTAGEEGSETDRPTPRPSPPPTVSRAPTSDRYAVLASRISKVSAQSSPSTAEALRDGSSPQRRALAWLADEDGNVDPGDENGLVQRFALATLFFSTGGEDSWSERFNFLSDGHECGWNAEVPEYGLSNPFVGIADGPDYGLPVSYKGVLCAENETSVSALSIPKNAMAGRLPEELGLLKSLTYIDFASNSLTGPLPLGFGNLENLSLLSLVENRFTGALPSSLGNLVALEALHLHNNEIEGTIPPALGKLSNLKDLWLGFNMLSGPIPPAINGMAALESLFLSNNFLNGTLPFADDGLPNLRLLVARRNFLNGGIPYGVYSCTSLEWVNLRDNALAGTLSPTISNLQNLVRLEVWYNRLSGTVPPSLSNLGQLKVLRLSGNRFVGTLPSALGGLAGLQTMALDTNRFTGTVPQSFIGLSSLFTLTLQNNSFNGDISFLCGNSIAVLFADCYGDDPEVSCGECCTACCSDTEGLTGAVDSCFSQR